LPATLTSITKRDCRSTKVGGGAISPLLASIR
jgi:hypothetical protein